MTRLKAVIHRKWGESAPISKAITAVEEDPTSKAQAAVLEEKVAAVDAAGDEDVTQALQRLLEQLKAHKVGGEPISTIQLNISGGTQQGIVGAQNVHVGSMTFNAPSKS